MHILTLDGGGSKGMYTLGVLSELEKGLGSSLFNHFNLIYGTSTGAIIASLLGLGYSVDKIKEIYLGLIPSIMSAKGQKKKSRRFQKFGKSIYGDMHFDAFKTGIGLVAINYETQRPLVFKNTLDQAHGVKSSFIPGFGVSILDAVMASSAACPIFCKKELETSNKGKITAIDGGFIANNPTLFALIDAIQALHADLENLRVLSIGVGSYIEKHLNLKTRILGKFEMAQVASKVMVASSNTTETVTRLLFPKLNLVRVNDVFHEAEYTTNMIEKDKAKLEKMFQLGIRSYAGYEKPISDLRK